MKIHELLEAIKGWKHAHSDLMRIRADHSALSHRARLVSLKKDGTESKMHDATSTYPTEEDARKRHADLVKLNPGRNIRHNLYVDDNLVDVLDSNTVQEASHKVGAAAEKALRKTAPTVSDQEQAMHKWQQLDHKEKEIRDRPDANTGKYAKELMSINRQKVKVATAGGLNAFGKPLMEFASGGGTSAASVASVVNPFGIVMRRPSLFGYVAPTPNRKKGKKGKSSSKS